MDAKLFMIFIKRGGNGNNRRNILLRILAIGENKDSAIERAKAEYGSPEDKIINVFTIEDGTWSLGFQLATKKEIDEISQKMEPPSWEQ